MRERTRDLNLLFEYPEEEIEKRLSVGEEGMESKIRKIMNIPDMKEIQSHVQAMKAKEETKRGLS